MTPGPERDRGRDAGVAGFGPFPGVGIADGDVGTAPGEISIRPATASDADAVGSFAGGRSGTAGGADLGRREH